MFEEFESKLTQSLNLLIFMHSGLVSHITATAQNLVDDTPVKSAYYVLSSGAPSSSGKVQSFELEVYDIERVHIEDGNTLLPNPFFTQSIARADFRKVFMSEDSPLGRHALLWRGFVLPE